MLNAYLVNLTQYSSWGEISLFWRIHFQLDSILFLGRSFPILAHIYIYIKDIKKKSWNKLWLNQSLISFSFKQIITYCLNSKEMWFFKKKFLDLLQKAREKEVPFRYILFPKRNKRIFHASHFHQEKEKRKKCSFSTHSFHMHTGMHPSL